MTKPSRPRPMAETPGSGAWGGGQQAPRELRYFVEAMNCGFWWRAGGDGCPRRRTVKVKLNEKMHDTVIGLFINRYYFYFLPAGKSPYFRRWAGLITGFLSRDRGHPARHAARMAALQGNPSLCPSFFYFRRPQGALSGFAAWINRICGREGTKDYKSIKPTL
jgi:hypothetical protein